MGPMLVAAALMGLLVPTASVEMRKNPIRKVVTMLQDMQKSVEEESEKQEELFDKAMCYCKTQGEALAGSIEEGSSKAEELTASVTDAAAQKAQLEQEIAGHKADRAEAEKQVSEASELRKKEVEEFQAASGEMKANIQSMSAALEALQKGGSAALLQTGALGETLRQAVSRNDALNPSERSELLALLTTGESEDAAGSSDQIIGVVSQMLDETKAALEDATKSEGERKANFEALTGAKQKELKAATLAIEAKMGRAGEAAVTGVESKGELEAVEKALSTDKEMKVSLGETCATREKEYAVASKERADEQTALSETVKILNDDDALELFKKAVPAASLLQTGSRTRAHARAHARAHQHGRQGLRLRAAARRARMVSSKGFEKVVKMVDNMVTVLKSEQTTDDEKHANCLAEIEKGEATKKELEAAIASLDSAMEEKSDEVSSIAAEVEATKKGITDLDKSVAAATEQRKEEHAAFVANQAANNAAIDLLKMAANRMNKFYNPSSYKEPAKEEELVQTSTGSDNGGIIFVQVRSQTRMHKEQAGGVMALLTQISGEVQLGMNEDKHDEDDAQKEYEKGMTEAAAKRAADSQMIVRRETEKAEAMALLADLKSQRQEKYTLDKVAEAKLEDMHKFCDILLETFAKRKEARQSEIESDEASKAVLAAGDAEPEE